MLTGHHMIRTVNINCVNSNTITNRNIFFRIQTKTLIFLNFNFFLDCRCTEFIDDYGFGNCTRADTWFGFKFSCYVNENSTCNDTLISRFDPDKKVSAKACIKHLEKFSKST